MLTLLFFQILAIPALALTIHTPRSTPTGTRDTAKATDYEYVVVGSGPGGSVLAARLALAGRKVLLLEAGDDHGDDIRVQAPNLFPLAAEDENIAWNYYVNHYQDTSRQARDNSMVWETSNGTKVVGQTQPPNSQPLGILYPRTGALGGCANHNAMITIYPFESDWNHIADITGDDSWSADRMRKYFERLERNSYLPPTPGHGFDGWLNTKLPNYDLLFSDDNIFTTGVAALKALGQASGRVFNTIADLVNALHPDINNLDPDRDSAQNIAFRAVESVSGNQRSSPRDFVLSVANMRNEDGTRKYQLDIQLNTLVTKVRFALDGEQPRAVGVDYLQGPSLYAADPRANLSETQGVPGSVNASREVVLAAGAFNTPQLLKLSGIGPRAELDKFEIPVVVDLPGVGTNMQDRYEITLISETAHKSSVYRNCTYLEGSDDPCAEAWLEDSPASPYSSSGSTIVIPRRSSTADNTDNDIITMSQPGYFNGYFPGFSRFQPNRSMTYETWVFLKAHSRNNAGTVTLRSSNPRHVPIINFNSFDTGVTKNDADKKDVGALVELLEFGRQILGNQSNIANAPQFNEITPGPSVSTRAEMEQYVKDNAWGHHASCSSPIGSDSDPMAVLDSRFQVRGVTGLRVVDASVFPKIPSTFIVVPVYMVGEKAADVILEDAA